MNSPTAVLAGSTRPANLSVPMRLEDFFQTLFAALRIHGLEFIDTRGDRHQALFSRVADWLYEHPKDADRLGVYFFPSPFNGRYADFDAELLKKQVGLLGAKNPFYPGIHLQFSPERAETILQENTPENRELFRKLAEVFLEVNSPVDA